jgi:TolB protein
MRVDGTRVERLCESPTREMRPAWSPDGRRIAFTSVRDGSHEIYVINADGSGLRRITNHPERDDFAAWHPDGNRVVAVSERDGEQDLWLYEVE